MSENVKELPSDNIERKKHSWKRVDKGHSICRKCGLHRFDGYNGGIRKYGTMDIRLMKYQECIW